MAETVLPKRDPEVFPRFLQEQGRLLRVNDRPPRNRMELEERRKRLRQAIFAAMGSLPTEPTPLEARTVGEIRHPDYRIEKVIFQPQPDVWVSSSLYIPVPAMGRLPTVLAVHGHWPWARRDPVVQARCLGLVKLGFVVLAVDAFGSGERYMEPARGTYHGALCGGALWPAGMTLLGQQVYENRRALDYLRSRPEVDPDRFGITGASGGGNQSLYAGALDERIRAVVPVCGISRYQAYLRAACCVCEMLPGALRFTELGDVLSLVAPRALLVLSATKDAYQFSSPIAEESVKQAEPVFRLLGVPEKIEHRTFDSGHDYSQPMREAMYGWMTRWLKGEGEGKPIPEPTHQIEKVEDLACWPDGVRPKGFLFPPSLAQRGALQLLARYERLPGHREDWESTATALRDQLRQRVLGGLPRQPKPVAQLLPSMKAGELLTTPLILQPEPNLPLPVLLRSPSQAPGRQNVCVLLHLKGKDEALAHPLAKALLDKGWLLAAPDLRGTGETQPERISVRNAPDHTMAEHGIWIGRPLLGQWVVDVQSILDWIATQPSIDPRRCYVAGIGQAATVALTAAALLDTQIAGALTVEGPTTYVTDVDYAPGTFMGLLAPGILQAGDLPQIAACIAPRRLWIADGVSPLGVKQTLKLLREAYAYTSAVYGLYKAGDQLRLTDGERPAELLRTW